MDVELKRRVKEIINSMKARLAITPPLIECITCWEALHLSRERNNGRISRIVHNELLDRLDFAEELLGDSQYDWFKEYQMM
jgi:hypothetical protein